jgi:hypothetical protein
MPTSTESIMMNGGWPTPIKPKPHFSPKSVYTKKCEGGRISDADVMQGIVFFKELADNLVKCGPVFRLAFKEANDTYNTLHTIAVARNIDVLNT